MQASQITVCPVCGQKLKITKPKKRIRCPACKSLFDTADARDASERSLESAKSILEDGDSADLSSSSVSSPAARSKAEPTLQKLGRFDLKQLLGQGGFGRVYRAYDPQLERFVALKVPLFGPKQKTRIERFLSEAKASARLRHPNIVATFEAGKADKRYYMATEYVEGEPLSDIIKRDRPDVHTSVEIVTKLAAALAYAHSQGIIHRDIKPHNILIDKEGEPKLMDFGLAKRLDDDSNLTIDGALLGTPAYMSPEQARGESEKITATSDQYSLGVVLYHLLTGETPYQGSPHTVVAQVSKGEQHTVRSKSPSVDPYLDAICSKAMSPAVEDRYETCEEFASDLIAWSESRPLIARPITWLQEWSHHARRHKVAVGAAFSVVAVLIAATLFSLSDRQPLAGTSTVDAEFMSDDGIKSVATDEVMAANLNGPDIVFADFEDGTYGSWTQEGVSFGNAPRNSFITAKRDDQFSQHPWPMNGDYVADSRYAANGVCLGKFTGKLISPPFKVNRRFINFMGAAKVEYVRLVVSGNVVLTGKRNLNIPFDRISPITMDVGEYLGQTATIEIVDSGTGEHDHVLADSFVLSNHDLHDAWITKCIEQTKQQAVELQGRKYYFGPIPVTLEIAKDLAEVIGGRVLTVESEEEATALARFLLGNSWLGVKKKEGVWQNEDGEVYTHVDWGGDGTLGLPGPIEENTYLTPEGHYRHVSGGFRFPIIEFGPPQKPPAYELVAQKENRQLAKYLINSKATMIIATADRFHYDWLHNSGGLDKPLPAEPFEVQFVSLPDGFRVDDQVAKLFAFDNRIRHIEINNGNDDSLKIMYHLKNLRSLNINRGSYQSWNGLSELEEAHPLRKFHLSAVKFKADQIAPLFRAKGLEEVAFTSLYLSPEIGSLLASHSHSIVHFVGNGAPGLGRKGFAEFGKLKRLRHATLFGCDVSDEDLKFLRNCTSLTYINLGGNKQITGATLHELANWENMRIFSPYASIDDHKLNKLPVLPSLRVINLEHSSLTGTSLSRLCQFPSLERINLQRTEVENSTLQQLLNCKRLRRLEVKDTKVTIAGLDSFFKRFPGFSTDIE